MTSDTNYFKRHGYPDCENLDNIVNGQEHRL